MHIKGSAGWGTNLGSKIADIASKFLIQELPKLKEKYEIQLTSQINKALERLSTFKLTLGQAEGLERINVAQADLLLIRNKLEFGEISNLQLLSPVDILTYIIDELKRISMGINNINTNLYIIENNNNSHDASQIDVGYVEALNNLERLINHSLIAATRQGLEFEEHEMNSEFQKLKAENPCLLGYYNAFYHTLKNYFDSYEIASARILQGNISSAASEIENRATFIAKSVGQLLSSAGALAPGLILFESLISMIYDHTLDVRFTNRVDKINSMLLREYRHSEDIDKEKKLMMCKVALEATKSKKSEILKINSENYQNQSAASTQLIESFQEIMQDMYLLPNPQSYTPVQKLAIKDTKITVATLFADLNDPNIENKSLKLILIDTAHNLENYSNKLKIDVIEESNRILNERLSAYEANNDGCFVWCWPHHNESAQQDTNISFNNNAESPGAQADSRVVGDDHTGCLGSFWNLWHCG